MDITDKKILEILAKDADTTTTEISSAVNLSVPAVNKRIQKLQNDGIIRSFTIITDNKKVNKSVVAFIFIILSHREGTEELLEYVDHDKDILECYAVTGEYDYFIKICAEDVEELEKKLLQLKKQKGVVKSHTMFALMENKFQPTILPDMKEK